MAQTSVGRVQVRRADGEAWVRLLEADPELGDQLEDVRTTDFVRKNLVAQLVSVRAGCWRPTAELNDPGPGFLGLLIIGGTICRHTELDGTISVEVLGPGDVIRPWDDAAELLDGEVQVDWFVLRHTDLVLVDRTCALRAARWPEIASSLMGRFGRRIESLSVQLTISHVIGVDMRLELLMRQIAARWGRVTSDGIVVPLELTNEMIGRIIGARRPSVSGAVTDLSRRGHLERSADGTWLLPWDNDSSDGANGRVIAIAGHGRAKV